MIKAIRAIKRIFHGTNDQIVRQKVAGIELQCTEGVLRPYPDYDDAWYFALAARSQRIMDVGANKGYTALLALLSGAGKELLLLDANSEALGVACRNVCMNDLGGTVLYQRALVSDCKGKELDFFTVGAGDAGSIHASHAKTAARMESSQRLCTTTIDDVAADYDFEPDLVKLDVEGAEVDALRGAKLIGQSNAVIFVEMHDTESLSMKDAAREIIDWAAAFGRTVYYLKEHLPLTDPQMVANRGKCHFLIQKADRPYPEYLRAIPQGSPLPDNAGKSATKNQQCP